MFSFSMSESALFFIFIQGSSLAESEDGTSVSTVSTRVPVVRTSHMAPQMSEGLEVGVAIVVSGVAAASSNSPAPKEMIMDLGDH